MVGARCPVEWQQQIRVIATASGRREAEVVHEALAQYLGQTDPSSVKGAIVSLEERVSLLEGKIVKLERKNKND